MSVDDYVPTKPFIKQELGGLVVQLSCIAHMSIRHILDTKPKPIQKLLSPSSFALVVISALLALNSANKTGKHTVHSNHSEGYIVVSDKLCLEMAFLSGGGALSSQHGGGGEAKTGGSLCVIEASLVYRTTSRRPSYKETLFQSPPQKKNDISTSLPSQK